MPTSPFRRLHGMPIALLLAAMAIACQSSAPAHDHAVDHATAQTSAGAAVNAPGEKTYFAQYGVSTHAYKPRRLNPSVDGSLYVRRMHWRVWNNHSAVGHGIAHVNDCKPYCAAGHYTSYPVTVRLAQPRELCGSRFFMAIRVRGSGYHTYAHWPGIGCH